MRYIQELLGHKNSKTTEIYTHVSNKDLSKIKSPLDLIMKNSYIENKVEGDEGYQSAKGRYIRSKFQI